MEDSVALADYPALVEALLGAAADPAAWKVFVERLGEALDDAAILLSFLVPGTLASQQFVAVGIEPEFVRSYASRYRQLDPACALLADVPPGAVLSDYESLSETPYEGSEFSGQWLAPQGFASAQTVVAVILRHEGRPSVILSIFRRRPIADAETATRLLRLLMPYMQHAMLAWCARERLRSERDGAFSLLDHLGYAVFAVDLHGEVQSMNLTAESILMLQDGLRMHDGSLRARHAGESTRLAREIAHAMEHGSVGTVSLTRRHRRPLELRITPVGRANGSAVPCGTTAMLSVRDPEHDARRIGGALRRRYGLSGAEAALAVQLAQGASLAEAAETLGVRISTTRTHLRSLFARTGTNRQSALVRLLLQDV